MALEPLLISRPAHGGDTPGVAGGLLLPALANRHGLIAGATLTSLLGGFDSDTMAFPGNPFSTVLGGLLVGLGTAIGNGCTSGHGICGIARLSAVIAAAGANVREIVHDRAFSGPDVFSTSVAVTVDTADRDHVAALAAALAAAGFSVG